MSNLQSAELKVQRERAVPIIGALLDAIAATYEVGGRSAPVRAAAAFADVLHEVFDHCDDVVQAEVMWAHALAAIQLKEKQLWEQAQKVLELDDHRVDRPEPVGEGTKPVA